ncbi:MAG: hypothetical protein PWQ54_1168 [Bacteroidales bacterium]|jgi:hypothetical protein|nr:hypothetical protein [Bacteroidales bacterium]
MRRLTKWVVISLFFLFAIGAGIYFYAVWRIKKELYIQFEKTPISAFYELKIKSVGLDFLTQNLILRKLSLIPIETDDTAALLMPKASLKINRLELKQLDIERLISKKELYATEILLDQPRLEVGELPDKKLFQASKKNDTTKKQGLKKIVLDRFILEDGFLSIQTTNQKENEIFVPSVSLKLEGIHVNFDSISHKPQLGISLASQMQIDSLSFRLPGTYYKLFVNTSEILQQEKELKLTGIKLYPIRGLHAQAVGLRKQDDVFEIGLMRLQTYGLDLDKLLNGHGLYMRKLLLEHPQIHLIRDKRLPMDEDRRPKMPQQALKSIRGNFGIDSIVLQNASVVYTELMGEKPDTPSVNFDSLFTLITGFASRDKANAERPALIANSKGVLFGEAHFENHIEWHFTAENSFDFYGRLGSMNANAVNVVSETAAGAAFRSGIIDSVIFKGLGNQDAASGIFEMRYHDLVVDITQKRSNNPNKFLSLVANLILRRENPAEGDGIRQVQMQTARVPYKGFFNMYWKTIENGLVNTLKPGKQQRLNKDDALRKEWERFKKDIAQ